jgi:hypothetical protein
VIAPLQELCVTVIVCSLTELPDLFEFTVAEMHDLPFGPLLRTALFSHAQRTRYVPECVLRLPNARMQSRFYARDLDRILREVTLSPAAAATSSSSSSSSTSSIYSSSSSSAAATRPKRVTPYRQVILENCVHLSSGALVKLARLSPHLRKLSVAGTPLVRNSTLRAFRKHAPALAELSVRRCPHIDRRSLEEISQLRLLQTLDVSTCPQVTSTQLVRLVRTCTLLRRLNVLSCTQLDDRLLFGLARFAGSLCELQAGWCSLFTDMGACALAIRRGGALTRVSLRGCVNLTDLTGVTFAQHCTSLVVADFAQVPLMTRLTLKCILARCPNLIDVITVVGMQTSIQGGRWCACSLCGDE